MDMKERMIKDKIEWIKESITLNKRLNQNSCY